MSASRVTIIGCGNLSFPAVYCLFRMGIQKVCIFDINPQAMLVLQNKIAVSGLKIESEIIQFGVDKVNTDIVILLLSGPQSQNFIKQYADKFHFLKEKIFISVGRPDYNNAGREKAFHRFLSKKKMSLLYGFGFEPGIAEAMLAHIMANEAEQLNEVMAICSGLPINPRPPLNYDLLFGEFLPTDQRIAIARINGKIEVLNRFDAVEDAFVPGIGQVEIYDDGLSPYLLKDHRFTKVRNIRQCTARWRGYCETIQLLRVLGFLSDEVNEKTGMSYKEITHLILHKSGAVRKNPPDVSFIYLRGESVSKKTVSYLLISKFDRKNQLNAMGLLTALLPCYLASGQIRGAFKASYGIHYSHKIFSKDAFEKFIMFGVKNNFFQFEVTHA